VGVLAIEFGWFAWIAFPIPFLVSNDLLTVSAVTVHALSLIWTFFSVGANCSLTPKAKSQRPFLFVAVFATGAVGSYFDVLWNPPLAPTLISSLAILSVRSANGVWDRKAAVWRGLVLASAWFAGFALAYLSKWVFAAAVIGPSTVSIDIVDQISLRISGEVDSRSVPILAATIAQLQDIGLITLAISWGAAAAIATFAMGYSEENTLQYRMKYFNLLQCNKWHVDELRRGALLLSPVVICPSETGDIEVH